MVVYEIPQTTKTNAIKFHRLQRLMLSQVLSSLTGDWKKPS